MARIGVVDIAYFRGCRGEIIVKELGICTFTQYTLNCASYTSCVFAPPYALSPQQHRILLFDTIGEANWHGIAWGCGDLELPQLGPILNRALADVALVYCKGAATVAFSENLLELASCNCNARHAAEHNIHKRACTFTRHRSAQNPNVPRVLSDSQTTNLSQLFLFIYFILI